MLIKNCIDLYIDDKCAGKNNETPVTYRTKINFFVRFAGEQISMKDIQDTAFKDFRKHLQSRTEKRRGSKMVPGKLSVYTIHTVMVTVRAFFKWAAQQGYLEKDITKDVKIPVAPKPNPKAISASDVEKIMRAAASTGELWERHRNLALLYILRDSGGRIGGLLNLEISDLELSRDRINVVEKGGTHRYIYVVPQTQEVLNDWLSVRSTMNPQDCAVFISYRGKRLTRSSVYGIFRKLAENAHIQGRYNPHSFRHAFARDTLSNGSNLSYVSQLMGHKNIQVTADYYTRWNDQELHKIHREFSPGNDIPRITPKGEALPELNKNK